MKKYLLILIILVVISSSYGIVCEDNIQPLTDCIVMTPSVICSSYTYNIYLNNGSLFENGNLTNFAESVYYFNFSHEKGDYNIILCDNSTRTIFVNYYNLSVFGQSFNWLAVIVIFITISLLSLWISKKITHPDLYLFKMLLFFYGMINGFIIVSLTLFISSGKSFDSFNDYFNVYVIIAVLLMSLFILYYVVFFILQIIKDATKGGGKNV